jgi:hypothetical protein
MTGLRDALHDLAEDAPRTDLSARVTARARRRRRVRLLTIPAVVTGVAAVTVAGSLLGATRETAGRHPAASHRAERPAPAAPREPVDYAYLDWCGTTGLRGKPVSGPCAQWHMISVTGKQWRVTDGLGVFPGRAGTTMNGSAPLKISDQGTRIAYYRPSDEHFVVRDLLSGQTTVIDRRVPPSSLEKDGADLMFSLDGRRLAVTFTYPHPGDAFLADTRSGAVRSLPGKAVVGLGEDASTVVLTEEIKGATWLVLSGPDGKVRRRVPLAPDVHLEGTRNLLAPDGHTLVALPGSDTEGEGLAKPMDTVDLVDARTGRTVATRHITLPKKNAPLANLEGWVGASTILVTAPWPDVSDGNSAQRGYLADLDTGRTRVFGTVDPHAPQTQTEFGAFGE